MSSVSNFIYPKNGVPSSKSKINSAPFDGKACGLCESCVFRKNAFLENGLEDETIYI